MVWEIFSIAKRQANGYLMDNSVHMYTAATLWALPVSLAADAAVAQFKNFLLVRFLLSHSCFVAVAVDYGFAGALSGVVLSTAPLTLLSCWTHPSVIDGAIVPTQQIMPDVMNHSNRPQRGTNRATSIESASK